MSVSLGANGANYDYPETGDLSWGANATNFASAVSAALAKLGLGATLTADAVINIASTTKGVLFPKMTTTQRDAIVSPSTGLLIYNTTTNKYNVYIGSAWLPLIFSGSLTDKRVVTSDANGNLQTTGLMYQDSSFVGIDTTTGAGKLTIAHSGGGNTSDLGIISDNAVISADKSMVFQIDSGNVETGRSFIFTNNGRGYSNGTVIFEISENGNTKIGGGAGAAYQLELASDSAGKPSTNVWTITSDERIKDNIVLADLDRCYEIVKNLPLKKYAWKYYNTTQAPDQNMLGWIAQDVQVHFPKAVQEHSFKISETESIDDCLNLNSDQINKALYGAVQKLQAIVETQQAKILELENRINTLEGN